MRRPSAAVSGTSSASGKPAAAGSTWAVSGKYINERWAKYIVVASPRYRHNARTVVQPIASIVRDPGRVRGLFCRSHPSKLWANAAARQRSGRVTLVVASIGIVARRKSDGRMRSARQTERTPRGKNLAKKDR